MGPNRKMIEVKDLPHSIQQLASNAFSSVRGGDPDCSNATDSGHSFLFTDNSSVGVPIQNLERIYRADFFRGLSL